MKEAKTVIWLILPLLLIAVISLKFLLCTSFGFPKVIIELHCTST